MAGVYDWNVSAGLNTSVGGINIAEGAPRANMNDAIRAVMSAVKTKALEAVSVLDATGIAADGVSDDSAVIQAFIDANKGKSIRFPAGYTFLAAGIALSGSTYNGTTLIIEGTFKMKASGGVANFGGASPFYGGIIVHDCENVTVDVPGMIDGNRAAQTAWEQHHALVFWGARDFRVPQFNAQEVRGDGIYISSSTNLSPLVTNSKRGAIGPVRIENSADDGRNAVSLVSGEDIWFAGGVSVKVGGVIGPSRMPGGFDIEPDGNWHLVKNIVTGPWVIETAGTSGIACIGHALTNDVARDWNIQNIRIAPSIVTVTAALGYPIFKRGRGIVADVACIHTGGRTLGCSIDYQDHADFTVRVKTVQSGVQVGNENFVNDSRVHVSVDDHSGAALQVLGANRCRFTGQVAPTAVAGSAYGVQITPGSRSGALTQTDCIYSVDVPYDANKAFGFLVSAGIAFTNCVVRDCAFTGYPNYTLQASLNVFLPTRNVEGRNFASAVPANGTWTASDIVWNTGTSAGGTPGWVCTTQGAAGVFVFKAMANVAA